MDIATVTRDIESWITNFLEVPHPVLGGFPPCPYARSARLKQSYSIVLGTDPLQDLKIRADLGLQGREVWIYVYDPVQCSHAQLSHAIDQANQEFLLANDLLALEDHPTDVENVNGVIMNQGTYALALVQGLSDLDHKARLMARQGFYDTWPDAYLKELFQYRQDPRP